jgi:hypothetical protein
LYQLKPWRDYDVDDLKDIDKVNETLMKRLQLAVVKKLLEKIEGEEGTSQDLNTAVRMIRDYNIDLDSDKDEDEMTPEEQAMIDEWNKEDLKLTEEDDTPSLYGPKETDEES